MTLVGLIANPMSSKDIRRLTGLARVIDIEEKANLVARFLVGLGAVPDVAVRALDDQAGLVRRAVALAGSAAAPLDFLEIAIEGSESDTRSAAALLAEMGASALATVGGDGTVRAAAEGWARAPLVPLAAGTNNAFAFSDEPTVVGLATGLAVTRRASAFSPTTAVEIETTNGSAIAVIDAVVVSDRWVGSGAIWEPSHLVEGLVTSARRTAVGIASVSAAFGPLADGHARLLGFGGSSVVQAVFGPGLVLDVPVTGYEDLPIGTEHRLDVEAGLVALDGERRLPAPGGVARVVDGPRLLDLGLALANF
ncbi:MAG: NAD(+)/NADH kinase [Acidimicrobiia bacterium]|nr:NAD(+)/NADH kinase [Acidimicrobiia bacterium]